MSDSDAAKWFDNVTRFCGLEQFIDVNLFEARRQIDEAAKLVSQPKDSPKPKVVTQNDSS